jgi:ZIP family zinc transporter
MMREFIAVLTVALLPVAGNIFGAVAAELARAPRWVVGAALHAAAGVAIALVTVELMPRALDTTAMWLIVLMFSAGAALSVVLYWAVARMRRGRSEASTGAWTVYVATSIDLLCDGLMTGASSAVSSKLGLLLGLSQVVGNLPGGFATLASLRSHQVPRKVRLLAATSFVLPVLVGAVLGFLLLRGSAERTQDAALAAIVGVLLVSTVEDLVPQADEPGTERWLSTTSFVGGFALFALLSAYLE